MSTQPLTPNDVALNLAELARLLDAAQRELVAADDAMVRARARYESAYARALLNAEGRNAEHRKAEATLATEREYLDKEIAEQQVRAVRGRIDVLKVRIDVGRSLGSTLRAEMQLGGAA